MLFSLRGVNPNSAYEQEYKKEIAKAKRWNELAAKYGNNQSKILAIMTEEGFDVKNYRSMTGQ